MVKILRKISDVIFAIIIIGLALYFVLRADNRIRIYSVLTGSMEDNIHVGDYILILKQDDYKIGDIVTFGERGYYVTHRIIRKEGDAITTKGDANNSEDATIDRDTIIGKVVLIGGVLNFLINYKFGLVGFLLGIYLLTYYLDGREKAKKAESENLKEIKNEEIVPTEDEHLEETSQEDNEYVQTTVDEPILENEETQNEVVAEVEQNDVFQPEVEQVEEQPKAVIRKKTANKKVGEGKTQKKKTGDKKASSKKSSKSTSKAKSTSKKSTKSTSTKKTSKSSKKSSSKSPSKKGRKK